MRQPALGNFEVTESITTQRALLFPGPAQKSWPICAQQESVRALPKSSRTQMSYFAVILVCNSSEEENISWIILPLNYMEPDGSSVQVPNCPPLGMRE